MQNGVETTMSNIIWEKDRIKIDPPKKPKKMTGTRFAAVLGLNPWASPFETWCAITRTYEKPFVDSPSTIAGKIIEPKQADYMKKAYLMDNLVTPTDMYGPDYFQKTWGDFFHDVPVLGGMWDYLLMENGKPTTVLEMKTTKRSEDWADDIPEYYALQAALYAYLLNVDDVIMVASFLTDEEIEHPETYTPTMDNTLVRDFKVSERYPDFDMLVQKALAWWQEYVETGISPMFDEKRKSDAEILKELRSTTVPPDADLRKLVEEAEVLKDELEAAKKEMEDQQKRYDTIMDALKTIAKKSFTPGMDRVNISGEKYTFTMSLSTSQKVDEAKLKADGLYQKYLKSSESYRMTVSEIKKEGK